MSVEQTQITVSTGPEKCTLRLCGVLGVSEAEALREAAIELAGQGKDVQVDWSEVEQIDASIVQVLIALRCELFAAGRTLLAPGPSTFIATYLQTAGLASLLEGVEAAK